MNINRWLYHHGGKQEREDVNERNNDLVDALAPLREALSSEDYRMVVRRIINRPNMSVEEISECVAEELETLMAECNCVLPEMSCHACCPEPWDGEELPY